MSSTDPGTGESPAPTGESPAVAATGRERLSSPRTDPATERQRVLEREKEVFRGMRFWTAFFGWLTATGTMVLLVALVGGIAALAGAQQFLRTTGGTQTTGFVSAILLFVILLVSYYAGGYVAGRMARFSGLLQGFAVWLWAIIVGLILGIVGAVAGTQTNLVAQLGSVPALPLSPSTLTLAGIVSAVIALLVILIGSLLGGLAGMRYHRRVDRVGLEDERPPGPHLAVTADAAEDKGVDGELRNDRYVGDRPLTQWESPPGRAIARATVVAGRRVGAHTTLVVTLGIGVVVAFLMSFLVARIYDGVTDRDGISVLDVPVLATAKGLRSPALDWFSAIVAYVFGPIGMPLMTVAAILVLALRRRSWTPVILIGAGGIGSLLMTIAGKDIIGRHRPLVADAIPPYEYSPSFPSGHTLNATVIAGIIAYLLVLRRRTAIARGVTVALALLVAATVGVTRIVLAAHWFTDVLAGWLLGLAWLAIVITAHRLYLTARERGAPSALP